MDFRNVIEYAYAEELDPCKFLHYLGCPTGKYARRLRRQNPPLDTEWHLVSHNDHQKFHTCIIPTDGFSPYWGSYNTTFESDFGQIWRAENVHQKKNDAVMTAVRKPDRGRTQMVFFHARWPPHPGQEPPISTIGYCFHTPRKFPRAEVVHIHPGLPVRLPGPANIKYSRARDPENYATSSLNLDCVSIPLLPF